MSSTTRYVKSSECSSNEHNPGTFVSHVIIHSASQFSLHSTTIRDIIKVRIESMMENMDDFAEEMTAYAHGANSTYPSVTIPFFEVKASHVRRKAGVEILTVQSLVTAANLAEWESYSVDNAYWVEQGRDIASGAVVHLRYEYENVPILPFVGERETSADGSRTVAPVLNRDVHAPMCQFSPPNSDYVNLDSLSFSSVASLYLAMAARQAPTFGAVRDISGMSGVRTFEEHNEYHTQFVNIGEESPNACEHPHAIMLVPLYQDVRRSNETARVISGFLLGVMTFDSSMDGILPSENPGNLCCVEKHVWLALYLLAQG